MHCMDSDYSVFSILPPYNTIEAQLIVNGQLLLNTNGYRLTYEATPDPGASFNSTAMGKGNFYTYSKALFGATLDAEAGLAGWSMPDSFERRPARQSGDRLLAQHNRRHAIRGEQ